MKEKILPVIKKFLVFCIVFAIIFGVKEYKEANKMNEEFAAYAGVNSEMVSDAVTFIDDESATCTDNGVTITAKQAISDNHRVVVLLEVKSEGNLSFKKPCVFEWGAGNEKCFPVEDEKTLYIVSEIDGNFSVGDKVNFGLVNLVDYLSHDLVQTGKWQVSFELDGKDISKVKTFDEPVELSVDINGESKNIKVDNLKMEISPMTIYLTGEINKASKRFEFDVLEFVDIKLVTFGGKQIDCTNRNIMYRDKNAKVNAELMTIPAEVIKDNIEGVIINGTQFNFE